MTDSTRPDGSRIAYLGFDDKGNAFDQTGLYVMNADGSDQRRISFGQGRYSTPVWSPRGDMIAFTKQNEGRFHIGVMLTDGTEERLLTASFLDEGPTWAPNGRVVMFTREGAGAGADAGLHAAQVAGQVAVDHDHARLAQLVVAGFEIGCGQGHGQGGQTGAAAGE